MKCVATAAIIILLGYNVSYGLECSISDFDRSPPPHASDLTPATEKTYLEWSSDADPWGNSDDAYRLWHYVRNIHSQKLSIYWQKAGLTVPIDNPLKAGGIVCATEYAIGSKLDNNAPITTSNDGQKAAMVYVSDSRRRANSNPIAAGATIHVDYDDSGSDESPLFVSLAASYFSSDAFLRIAVNSGPRGEKLAFAPSAFGLRASGVSEAMNGLGLDAVEVGWPRELFKVDRFTELALGDDIEREFIRVSIDVGDDMVIDFHEIKGIVPTETNILLFSRDDRLLAIKRLSVPGSPVAE